jgi:hypothetical protein
MDFKKCSKCKKRKPISEFYKASDKKDGIRYQCKACCSESQSSRRNNDEYRNSRNAISRESGYYKKRHRNDCDNLTDRYVKKRIRLQYDLSPSEIMLIPQIIELKRIEIKNKRLCKHH